MLTYDLEARGGLSLYEYLYRRLRDGILSGALTAGERLPSKRALAEHLRVSVVTVEGAYQQLEAEGYVDARPRSGFFVSQVDRRLPAADEGAPVPAEEPPRSWRLDLKSGRVDPFPSALWARLTRQVLSEGSHLSPAPYQGLLSLREAIAQDLRDFKGMAVSPEQIVVGAGAEYLYLLLAQLLGREARQEVRVEVPRQEESQRQDLYEQQQEHHQRHQQEQRRRQERSGEDFLQQLRLGLIPMDGE